MEFLQEYTFVFKHKNGICNKVVDALRRRLVLLNTMCAQLEGFDTIRNTYSNDEDFEET